MRARRVFFSCLDLGYGVEIDAESCFGPLSDMMFGIMDWTSFENYWDGPPKFMRF